MKLAFNLLKLAVVNLSAVFAVTALASTCPELTGSYVYKNPEKQEDSFKLDITQSETAGITSYNVSVTSQMGDAQVQVIADGVTRKYEDTDSEGVYAAEETYQCGEQVLLGKIVESYTLKNGEILVVLTTDEKVSINTNSDLVISSVTVDNKGETSTEERIFIRQK